jgi:hypothetical protein
MPFFKNFYNTDLLLGDSRTQRFGPGMPGPYAAPL